MAAAGTGPRRGHATTTSGLPLPPLRGTDAPPPFRRHLTDCWFDGCSRRPAPPASPPSSHPTGHKAPPLNPHCLREAVTEKGRRMGSRGPRTQPDSRRRQSGPQSLLSCPPPTGMFQGAGYKSVANAVQHLHEGVHQLRLPVPARHQADGPGEARGPPEPHGRRPRVPCEGFEARAGRAPVGNRKPRAAGDRPHVLQQPAPAPDVAPRRQPT